MSVTTHHKAARALAALLAGTALSSAGSLPACAAGFTSNGTALIYTDDSGAVLANTLVTEDGYYYHTDANGAMENGWITMNGQTFLFDGLGRLVAGGATPDGKVVDGTGALVGTIGVDCACIKSVTTDGAFYTYTIDPTPDRCCSAEHGGCGQL